MPGALIDAVEVLGGHIELEGVMPILCCRPNGPVGGAVAVHPAGDGIRIEGLAARRVEPALRSALHDQRAAVRAEVITRAIVDHWIEGREKS